MAEIVQLTAPEVIPAVSNATYQVVYLGLDWINATIQIRLRGANGESKSVGYGGDGVGASPAERTKALNLMIGLNKANLTIKSLHRRILEQLIADGLIAGAINGAPD